MSLSGLIRSCDSDVTRLIAVDCCQACGKTSDNLIANNLAIRTQRLEDSAELNVAAVNPQGLLMCFCDFLCSKVWLEVNVVQWTILEDKFSRYLEPMR